jgi:acyl-CoA thioesterase
MDHSIMPSFMSDSRIDHAVPHHIAQTFLAREGTGPAWGSEIEEVGLGYACVNMNLTDAMMNGFASVHGGMTFALADTAFAYFCKSRNVATVAQSCTVDFLKVAKSGEQLIACASEKSVQGRSGVYAGTVTSRNGGIIAEMMGLSRSLDKPLLEERELTL